MVRRFLHRVLGADGVLSDGALAGWLIVLGLTGSHLDLLGNGQPARLTLDDGLVVALFLPLAWRVRYPPLVVVLVGVASASTWMFSRADGFTAIGGAIALYTLGRHVERPASIRWFAVTGSALAAVAAMLAVDSQSSDGWLSFFARCGVIVASFWFGDAQQSREQLVQSLRDRAERAEEHRLIIERQAVLDERNRIARELHDVVAHSLSVMVVQATAALSLAEQDSVGSAAAMQNVADVGRGAMGEMRHILGLLDDGAADGGDLQPESFVPQPRLSDLDALIDRYRQAGLDVAIDRPESLPELPAAVELTAVRIVQEGLTNVLKHAPGSPVVVRLTLSDRLEVDVVNRGRGTPREAAPGHNSGRGLIGMRQRVDAHGGTLRAAPDPGSGGFAVRATLPVPALGAGGRP